MADAAAGLALLAAGIRAGLTPHLALIALRRSRGPVGTWGSRYWAAHLRGEPFAAALLASRGDVVALARAAPLLAAASEQGFPVAAQLERLAADLAAESARERMRRVRKLPVAMLFPLVFLVLPSFVLLTIMPVVFGAIDSIRGAT